MKFHDEDDERLGRWSKKEHRQFLEGLNLYGRNWKIIADTIKTRSSTQVRSHAQKYFIREAAKQQMNQNLARNCSSTKENFRVAPVRQVVKCIERTDIGTQYGEGMIFPTI